MGRHENLDFIEVYLSMDDFAGLQMQKSLLIFCLPVKDFYCFHLINFMQCHKAKNLIPEAGGQPTRTGEAVLDLQVAVSH